MEGKRRSAVVEDEDEEEDGGALQPESLRAVIIDSIKRGSGAALAVTRAAPDDKGAEVGLAVDRLGPVPCWP